MSIISIENIEISRHEFNKLVKRLRKVKFDEQIGRLNFMIELVAGELTMLLNRSDWLKIEEFPVYYNHSVCGLFPDLTTFSVGHCNTYSRYNPQSFNNFKNFNGSLMTKEEFNKVFANKRSQLVKELNWPALNNMSLFTVRGDYVLSSDGTDCYMWNGYNSYESYHIPIFRLKGKNAEPVPVSELVRLLLRNSLSPAKLSKQAIEAFNTIRDIYRRCNNPFDLDNNLLVCNRQKFFSAVDEGTFDFIPSLKLDKIEEQLQKTPISDSETISCFARNLLNCEKIRADIEPYDSKILSDPNRGHWDIWKEGSHNAKNDTVICKIKQPFMARDPIEDINEDGVIGIDFGTKSTVVVFQKDNDHTMPMRIGTGRLSKEIESAHYENPTIMQFINLEAFLSAYKNDIGRPKTQWEHLTTSHTAFSGFLGSKSNEYYSFLFELKQWAGDKRRQLRLKDKNNVELILPPYPDMHTSDLDPIELYAYYIGLSINNMHNGIYLDYQLSYPTTYEKAVKDKIAESFRRGIEKSLPPSIICNTEIMKRFRVCMNVSEPVAYAVCALEEFGFEPTGDEKIFYGIFDFGGGTTDFDFGIFREANLAESRRYDYVVESFGAGGDKFLGGENILELLAFEIFKYNQEKLRLDGITFFLPPECKRFLGDEVLISDSEEAKKNMLHLMSKLRPFWECHDNYEKDFEKGLIKVSLFNKSGEAQDNYELKVDSNMLSQIISERIEKGVNNFFQSLREAFRLPINTDDVTVINIFLAGNSSKSKFVSEAFAKQIENYDNWLNDWLNKDSADYVSNFKIFPPLGTEAAIAIQKENGVIAELDSLERPTGKTGVAFGLVKCRSGGRIKHINEISAEQEKKFNYYLGIEKKRKFKVIKQRNQIHYNEWFEFIDASERDFTIYYSSLAECISGKMDIKSVSRKKCMLAESNTDPDVSVYIRAATPNAIEFVVAHKNELQTEKYLSAIERVELR